MKKIPLDPGDGFVRSLATSPQLLESCHLQRAYSSVRLLSSGKFFLVSDLHSAPEDPLVVCFPATLQHVYMSEVWTLPKGLSFAPGFLRVSGYRRTRILESCLISKEAGAGLLGLVWLGTYLCHFLLNQAESWSANLLCKDRLLFDEPSPLF